MKNKYSKNNYSKIYEAVGSNLSFILIFLLLAITPLVVLCTESIIAPSMADFYEEPTYDFFVYYKSRMVFYLAALCTIGLCIDIFVKGFKDFNFKSVIKNPIFIGSFLIIVFTFLSFCFSDYKDVVLTGGVDRYESIFVAIGYLFIMFFVARFCNNYNNVNKVIFSITFGAFFIGLIGFLQSIEFYTNLFPNTQLDPFNWEFVKKLYLGKYYVDLHDILEFKFSQVYSTLFNPNYVGMYGALYMPIGIASVFACKKNALKIFAGITTILIFISTVGSKSDAGIIAMAASLFLALILVGIYYFKVLGNKKVITIILGGMVALSLLTTIFYFAIPSINSVGNKFIRAVFGQNDGSDIYSVGNELYIKLSGVEQKIVIHKEGIVDLYEGEDLLESIDYGKVPMNDLVRGNFSDGSKWALFSDGSTILYEFKSTMFFMSLIDGEIYLRDSNMEYFNVNAKIPSFGFEGIEKFGTGRGFIWSRMLPIAFKSMIIGAGSDTFVLLFPQEDLKGKLLYINNLYITVDKAHSIYLQYWVTTGFLTLLGYLFILFGGMLNAIKGIFAIGKDKAIGRIRDLSDEKMLKLFMLMGILISIVGYSISGLTADQNVSVSQLYWALIGICFSKWTLDR